MRLRISPDFPAGSDQVRDLRRTSLDAEQPAQDERRGLPLDQVRPPEKHRSFSPRPQPWTPAPAWTGLTSLPRLATPRRLALASSRACHWGILHPAPSQRIGARTGECAPPLVRIYSAVVLSSPSSQSRLFPECARAVSGGAPAQTRFATPDSYTPKLSRRQDPQFQGSLRGCTGSLCRLLIDRDGSYERLDGGVEGGCSVESVGNIDTLRRPSPPVVARLRRGAPRRADEAC